MRQIREIHVFYGDADTPMVYKPSDMKSLVNILMFIKKQLHYILLDKKKDGK